MIAAISWRNVWRNKLRSIVIIMAISVGLTGGIFTVALHNGLTDQKLRTAIDTQTAHLQIHARGFQQNRDIRLYLTDPERISDAVESLPALEALAPRLVSSAMAATSNANAGVQMNGIIPEKEHAVSTIYQSIVAGTYFGEEKRNQIIISSRTAKKLKAGLNSKIVITLQDFHGDIVGAAFRVTGIYKTSHSMFDDTNVFIRKPDMERILSMPGMVNEMAIRLTDIDAVAIVRDTLQSQFPPDQTEIQSWREIQPELAYITDATWQLNYLILIIILLALAFGILNTMLMAIFERVKEIGVLMAVGMSKARIFVMIILETVFLSLTGAAVGMVISAWLVYATGKSGIDLSMFAQGLEAIGLASMIYPKLNPQFYVTLAIMVIIAALISSLYPAIRALRLKPVEAIHG